MADQASNGPSGLEQQELTAATEGLRKALATALDANDLGRLAQMHTGCQTLSAVDGFVGEVAAALANLLEGVILKEAADPEGGLRLIPQAIETIENALAGQNVDAGELLAQIGTAATGGPGLEQEGDSSSQPQTETVPEPQAKAPEPAPSPAAPQPPPQAPVQPAADAGASAAPPLYISEPLSVDLSEREHLDGFIEEGGEHMDTIEVALLEVEKDPTNTDKINELFRPFHTIKGIAGFLNLRDINRLTHEVETILDLGRKNELKITADTIDLIFTAIDLLKQQIGGISNFLANPTGDTVPQPNIVAIMAQLQAVASGSAPPPAAAPASTAATDQAAPAPAAPSAPAAVSSTPEPRKDAPPGAGGGPGAPAAQAAETSIRVDTAKLDFLVDAVGELVIAQTMVNLSDVISTDEKLGRDVSQVSKIVRDVQETAMAMRMVPVGHTFQKMRRLVRDVSRKAGKDIELKISGEETELDKNVIQAISDPLVHMVRNAVDHGIEAPDGRRAAGKPEAGVVQLDAYHQGDSIVIEIRDDGKGLDREKLIAKGIERGLVAPDEQLTDQQVFGLVMQAGFSTAEQVTDISGRGVGMDVVRRNVERLRGKIEISSELGRGSVFSIRLPLTLAIIDGMLVRVGDQRLIIPTILIEQSLRPEERQVTAVQRRGSMIQVRGELITLVQLGALFGFTKPVDPVEGLVVIAQTESQKIGIVVDQLIGQQQVVIKTLGERFKHAKGISGAAILGDGHVGLILEPTGLLALHNATGITYAGDEPTDSATSDDSSDQSYDPSLTETNETDAVNAAESAATS